MEMSAIISTFAGLREYLEGQIDKVLANEVMDLAIITAQLMGEAHVYAAYGTNETGQPKTYVRRGDTEGLGGLTDKDSFKRVLAAPLTLEIINIAKPNPKFPGRYKVNNLAQLVELGDGNGGKYSHPVANDSFGDFHGPRPFMAETQKELNKGNTLSKLMIDGLKKRGLTVR